MTIRRREQLKMVPSFVKREGPDESARRSRVDDTDPSIIFSPGSSPYQDPAESLWTVIHNPLALNSSAVMTNRSDAHLSFQFPGESLALGLLYKANGTSLTVTIDNGSSFPFQVTTAEATASAPNGNLEALQKKIFHIDHLACTNHTATLSPSPIPGGQGADPNQTSVYFDGFSFASADDLAACAADRTPSSVPSSSTETPSPTDTGGQTSTASATSDDSAMLYAGIGAGAAVFAVILAILLVRCFCGRKRRQASAVDPIDRSYRPARKQTSDKTVVFPLSVPPSPATPPEPVFRPRGIHALAQDDSFTSVHCVARPSTMESASASSVFPLLPVRPADHPSEAEAVSFITGSALTRLPQHPMKETRKVRNSGRRISYGKARDVLLPSVNYQFDCTHPSTFHGEHVLQYMPHNRTAPHTPRHSNSATNKALSPNKSPRRPKTTSAVDRLRTQATQLDIQRPLSPFDRSRPATSSNTNLHQHSWRQPRLATAPADPTHARFRRNSVDSGDTHWSRASADADTSPANQEKDWSKGEMETVKVEKTTDSEAEMWISKAQAIAQNRKRRKSTDGTGSAPKRPPKSPHRPSTGQAAPPPMSYQPFTIG
ncbi:hypothetical protein PHSY_000814 [Pseudozyma hubeiensis SY62]|uniref:Uncharacterized protein n=1 Tax=Pseudozyma hubeiensis (strain SY62) TaxID=1305764 RepID=R9P567_PSEHS|nr:hypothetical protein PHSY_000814 [Pseudozyma hubeiensis SY62]GAC93250.1 hypothetical protein PHSY_000814 [Pseudozyma hubeiensis SY62]